jgi:DNA polymerase-3 subunit epsilon
MRLLQLKEAKTGLKFTNPVLDTLLLAAIIHPNDKDYTLETIAQRLGINVMGRHTSLGDAILTGEIFLKQIPLLAEQGITTLGEARQAAEKTYYARLNY